MSRLWVTLTLSALRIIVPSSLVKLCSLLIKTMHALTGLEQQEKYSGDIHEQT